MSNPSRPAKRAKALDPIKQGLCEALKAIPAPGSFAAAAKLSPASVLPISVRDGIGPVTFPLLPHDTQHLISLARQAPYGKGTQTFVDTSVRNTWELDASQLELGDAWLSVVRGLAVWAAKQLGVAAPVTAELYKMLLYEKGALFKPHTDTEKIRGMFGTMIVCLPSAHQGGDLVLRHGGITKMFKSSEMQPSAFCWFSDVSHEVLPVTSGVRCVLTFNLASSQPPPRALAVKAADRGTKEVRGALRAWLQSRSADRDATRDGLYYMLDHTYTEARVSLTALKGADLARVRVLDRVCGELDVHLTLALLEKEEEGGCEDNYGEPWGRGYYNTYDEEEDESEDEEEDESEDEDEDEGEKEDVRHSDENEDEDNEDEDEDWHPFIEIYNTKLIMKKLVNLDGTVVRAGVQIGMEDLEANLIQDDRNPFKGAQKGERDYSGFTGNEGVSATHWYRKTVAVLVPKDSWDRFLLKGVTSADAQALLPQYFSKCDEPQTSESGWKMIEHLARLAWSPSHRVSGASLYWFSETRKLDVKIAVQFFRTTLSHNKYKLFGEALGWLKYQYTALAMPLFEMVGSAALSELVDFEKIKGSLLDFLSMVTIGERESLSRAVANPGDSTCRACVSDWVAQQVVPQAVTLCSGQLVTSADGRAIVEMISRYRDLDFFSKSFAPVLESQTHLTSFAIAALLTALKLSDEGFFETAATVEVCKPLFKMALDKMDLSKLNSSEGTLADTRNQMDPRGAYSQIPSFAQGGLAAKVAYAIEPGTLALCVAACVRYKWDDLLEHLPTRIIASVDCIPITEFHPLWIPCLRTVIQTLEENKVPLSTPSYQQLARAILESYADNYVGKEPSGAVDNRQQPVSCSCWDCGALNRFLTSDQTVGRFPLAEKRRRHLQHQLDVCRAKCTHVTERKGSPYTLVVKKGMDAGTRAVQDWNQRFYEAQQHFSHFDAEKMKVLLGHEDWERISSMRDLRYTGPTVRNQATKRACPRPPLVNVGNVKGAGAPAATRKPAGTLAGRKCGGGDADEPIVLD